MTAAPCTDCGEPTAASYRQCDTCRRAQVEAERVAQGLPPVVDDPLVLDRARTIIAAAQSTIPAERTA